MKKPLIKKLMLAALAVGVICLAVHAGTFAGIDARKYFPPVFILHIVVIAIFIPTVIVVSGYGRSQGKGDYSRRLLKSSPIWLKIIFFGLMLYTAFNFMSMMTLNRGGGPHIMDGKYVIANHGEIIDTITKQEYEKHRMYELRGFSGFWLMFSFGAALILFMAVNDPSDE